jgi:hypothetical protein
MRCAGAACWGSAAALAAAAALALVGVLLLTTAAPDGGLATPLEAYTAAVDAWTADDGAAALAVLTVRVTSLTTMSLFLVTASLTEPIEQPPVDAGGGAADYSRVALLGVTSDNMPFASQTLWPAGGRLDAATRMVVGDATVANMTIPLAFEDSRPVDCSGFASALACAQALCPSGGVSYSAPPTVASCDRYFILSSVCLVYDPVRGVVDGGCASYAGAAPGAPA